MEQILPRNPLGRCPIGDWQVDKEEELDEVVVLELLRDHIFVTHPPEETRRRTAVWTIGPVVEQKAHRLLKRLPTTRSHKRRRVDVSFVLQDNQQVDLAVNYKDAAGNPTQDTGALTWAVDVPDLLTLTPTSSGATVAATGLIGSALVTVVDVETNGDNFMGSLAIDVIGGPTSVIEVTPGTPTTKV